MRTKYVLAVAAASAFLSLQAASAEPVPSYTWSGFYYGGHFGVSIDQGSTGIAGVTPALALLVNNGIIPSSVTSNPSGPLAGLQLGYNFQRGKIVYGVEADLSLAAIEGKSITATTAIVPIARYTTICSGSRRCAAVWVLLTQTRCSSTAPAAWPWDGRPTTPMFAAPPSC